VKFCWPTPMVFPLYVRAVFRIKSSVSCSDFLVRSSLFAHRVYNISKHLYFFFEEKVVESAVRLDR
jgi:hypothetical protein